MSIARDRSISSSDWSFEEPEQERNQGPEYERNQLQKQEMKQKKSGTEHDPTQGERAKEDRRLKLIYVLPHTNNYRKSVEYVKGVVSCPSR